LEKKRLNEACDPSEWLLCAKGLGEQEIDRLLLVDYDTGAVLWKLDPHVSALETAAWRFSVGLVPGISAEVPPTETQVHPATVASTETRAFSESNLKETPQRNRRRVRVEPTNLFKLSSTPYARPWQGDGGGDRHPDDASISPRARAGHIQGDVVLHAIIDKEGYILSFRF